MKKKQLGKTNIYVTELGLGGAPLGNMFRVCSDEEARAVIQTAWDAGIRYFDTAPQYGHGLSERRFGDALRQVDNDFVLSTKVGNVLYAKHDVLPNADKFINKLPFHLRFDYTYDGVMRAFEDSLQRLGLNSVDILLLHDLDSVVHDEEKFSNYFRDYIEGGFKALDQLRSEGVIKALGLGVKKSDVCERVLELGDYECFMLHGSYTLLNQPLLNGFLQLCMQKKISILLAGPYESGILAQGANENAYYQYLKPNDTILKRVEDIQRICDAYYVPMKAVALQFPLKHAGITSVVVGCQSELEVSENIAKLHLPIPDALWQTLKDEKIISELAPI